MILLPDFFVLLPKFFSVQKRETKEKDAFRALSQSPEVEGGGGGGEEGTPIYGLDRIG